MDNLELYTFSYILNNALSRVSNIYDKRPGSIIYDAIAPICYELAQAYIVLRDLENRTYADTATEEDLERRTSERGIVRNEATKAIRLGTFNKVVPVGSRFSIEDATYVVTQNLDNNQSYLQCEQAGTIGNNYYGSMVPITFISGITLAQLTDIIIPGSNRESDDALRQRYFDDLDSQAFGGNQADYKQKTLSLEGVGGVKVYPVWAGGGTVKLVFADSSFGVPSAELVNIIQSAIDPIANSGEGLGIAPIGHIVTVESVAPISINVSVSLTLLTGYTWIDVESYVIDAIDTYLLSLRTEWDADDIDLGVVVRISQIETSILKVTGVVDIANTSINGAATNLILQSNEIPILGMVVNV